MSNKIASVMFVCIHNAGRSQMAAAYLSEMAGDRVEVRSSGTMPKDQVNPAVVEVMLEEGIDISGNVPKVLTDELVQDSDYVITMGCGDTCPYYPGKTYLDWPLQDPAGQGPDAIRPIRNQIKSLVQGLVSEIDAKNS
jgi:protein-tyrosine-phosphatase